jgi:hypothetical protein
VSAKIEQPTVGSSWNKAGTMEQRQIDLGKLSPMLTKFDQFKVNKVLRVEGEATTLIVKRQKKCSYDLSVWLECVVLDSVCELNVSGLCDYEDTELVQITRGANDLVKA